MIFLAEVIIVGVVKRLSIAKQYVTRQRRLDGRSLPSARNFPQATDSRAYYSNTSKPSLLSSLPTALSQARWHPKTSGSLQRCRLGYSADRRSLDWCEKGFAESDRLFLAP